MAMNFLIFGRERPKLSFRQDPKKGTILKCENKYRLAYKPDWSMKWIDIVTKPSHIPSSIHLSINHEQEWYKVVEELKALCQADVERIFLEKIAEEQKSCLETEEKMSYAAADVDPGWDKVEEADIETRRRFFERLLYLPALIPQVWLNWIHYDPKDRERAKKTHIEPFRVDFLYQSETELEDFKRVVVEIDDIWHIADIEKYVDRFVKSAGVRPSLEKFTEHLRKDRWLRCHGWEVCRFSALEVEKEQSRYLYSEMLGQSEDKGISPTYLPHEE